MSNIKYQPHIDGLRAIAVVSVLLYHIDSNWLPGGFVGVDIFFVISGYLITKIISSAIIADNFSIKLFYLRRIKRILPVYFLVSFISIIFAWLIFFPKDLLDFSNSLLSSALFVSNYYFWMTSDYFSSAIEYKPMVHTWSLSVEEQFYVFWPIFLILFFKIKNIFYRNIIVVVFILTSVILSYFLSNSNPQFAYYSIITRAYELSIGAVSALYIKEKLSKSKLVAYIGTILILVSIIFINKNMAFPSVIALIPCIGTACLIVAGRSESLPIYIIGSRIPVTIGLISYSLYMWHWPFLAFAKYYFTVLSSIQVVILILLTVLASYITRYTLEKWVLESKYGFKKAIVYCYFLPVILIFAFTIFVKEYKDIDSRFQPQQLALIEQTYSDSHNCSYEHFKLKFDEKCWIHSKINKPKKKILLWGDSHAEHFVGFFKEMVKHEAVDIYIMSFPGCPPISGVYRINRSYSQSCYEHNRRVANMILNNNSFNYVVLAANWSNYPIGNNLADDENKTMSINNSKRSFYSNLHKQLSLFSQKGVKTIFMNNVPNFENNASQCQLKNIIFGYPDETLCQRLYQEMYQSRIEYNKFLQNTVKKLDNILTLDFTDLFCKEGVCSTFSNGHLMYLDQNHISEYASRQLYYYTIAKNNHFLPFMNK